MHCPDSTIQALKLAQQNGHKIALCSGRPMAIIYPFLLELGFDGIVAAAGAYVRKGDEVIYHHTFDTQKTVLLTDVFKQHGAGYFMQGSEGIFVTAENRKGLRKNEPESDASRAIHSKMVICDHPEQMEGLECGVYFGADIVVSQMQKEVDSATDGYFQITGSSLGEDVIYSGEFTRKGVNKATGMQILMNALDIDREDSIAFGDGPNDVEMIQYAQTGVVMGNGFSDLKKVADYVTTDINDNGVWNGMKHLGLIG
jgi:hypothetical protein